MKRREQPIHFAVVEYLTLACFPPPDGPVVFHPYNGGYRTRTEAGIAARLGVKPGMPDIGLLWRGRHLWMEVKPDGGRLSTAQSACHQAITLAGGVVVIVRSVDDARDFLATVGIPTRETVSGGAIGR